MPACAKWPTCAACAASISTAGSSRVRFQHFLACTARPTRLSFFQAQACNAFTPAPSPPCADEAMMVVSNLVNLESLDAYGARITDVGCAALR